MTEDPEVKFRWKPDGKRHNSYHYLILYWHRLESYSISMARLQLYAQGELDSPFYSEDRREAHHINCNPWMDFTDNLEALDNESHRRITVSYGNNLNPDTKDNPQPQPTYENRT